MTIAPDSTTLVYLQRGTVAHVIGAMDQSKTSPCQRCGRRPRRTDAWRGTGNLNDAERAKRLPLCTPPPSLRWPTKEES